jgi:hypothetical protein
VHALTRRGDDRVDPPPPPRSAQNRSGSRFSSAVVMEPSAVTTVIDWTWSQVKP